MKRRTLLVAAAASLAGCATAPPPPKPRELTAAELFAAEPAALRAAVQTDARVLNQGVAIDLRLPEERFVVRLQQPAATDDRLAPAPPGRGWQVFAPAADAVATLATLRQMLSASAGVLAGITVKITAQPALTPADLVAAVPVRIDLLLEPRAGWITVADGTLDLRP